MQANIWTEHLPTPDAVFYAAFPRLAAFSEIVWSPVAGHDWQNFLQRVPAQMARYKALGIPYADAAFSVAISASKAASGAVVTLSNQTGVGTTRYTRDGSAPIASSPAYEGAFEVPLPATVTAATFHHGEPLAAVSQETITAPSLLKRNSYTLEQCSKEILLTQKGRSGAIVMVNIMNPCWIYRALDLSAVQGFDIAVTHMPFNFQIGDDIKKIPLEPKAARHGQLEIRLDDCKGVALAVLPLKPKTTRLKAKIKAPAGIHDICFVFARRKVDPIWAVDWVQPVAKE
jgi:hexosaminidase